MVIKNKKELLISTLRRKALKIAEKGIREISAENLIKSSIRYKKSGGKLKVLNKEYDILRKRLFVIGGGKASGKMAESLEKELGRKAITAGVVVSRKGNYKTKKIKIVTGGHPIPTKEGVRGIKEMLKLKDHYSISEKDLIICLISGGGSSMMVLPEDGITLEDKRKINKLLIESGAEIGEINVVRKHLSKVKGGKLGKIFAPSPVVSLIISDVPGNKLDVIASGPTYPDSTTFSNALAVLRKYNLLKAAPKNIIKFFKKGIAGEIRDNPKSLKNCRNFIIGDNKKVLEAMKKESRKMGFLPYIVTFTQKGETNKIASLRAGEIIKNSYKNYNLFLLGGETAPKLPKSHGKGGRCQHFALSTLKSFKNLKKDWVLLALATDGVDFLEGIGGVLADNKTLKAAEEKSLKIEDYLKAYDSYNFFKKTGNSLLESEPTDTNVSDIVMYMIK
jgi:hydroxypyruvate reductase/glycerate 2-kinase